MRRSTSCITSSTLTTCPAELDSEDEMDADPEIGAVASGDEDEDGSGMDSDHSD